MDPPNDAGKVTIEGRRVITRVIAHKMFAIYGDYPQKDNKCHVSILLGELLGFPKEIFYDPSTHLGFLARALENARKNWDCKHAYYSKN